MPPYVGSPREIPVRYVPRSRPASVVASALFIVGLISFVVELIQDPTLAWTCYVSNWLFFVSVAAGGVTLACATWLTKARWDWSVRRVSQAQAAFPPIAFALLLPMLGLGGRFFPWAARMAGDPQVRAKAAYLNVPFLVIRNVVAIALLAGLAVYFVYLAVRPDLGRARAAEDGDPGRAPWRARLTRARLPRAWTSRPSGTYCTLTRRPAARSSAG